MTSSDRISLHGKFLVRTLLWFIFFTGQPSRGQLKNNAAVEIITYYGYPAEEHTDIETEDGYLLDMQRIPHGINNGNETNKPPILLMHGLLGSAENWIVTGPEKGLAFILADKGYDVWLGNARGSTHSRKHKRLDPELSDFWKFSWHEIGLYDLPAKINHIVKATNQSEIFYLGHSQGTTSFFVMAAERSKFCKKIRLMVALAPVAYMSHLTNPFIQITSRIESDINWLVNLVSAREILPNSKLLKLADETFCNEEALFQEVCTNLLFLLAGYDSIEMNRTALPAILSASPAGASARQFLHYAQGVSSGSFRYYDYGLLVNMMKYDAPSPPSYRLNRITAPVALFYAKNDWLASVDDVLKLERELPNVVYSHLIPYERFNHLDFLWASDVVRMVYDHVIDLLAKS